MTNYHFHGKNSDIPLVFGEFLIQTEGYGRFDYYVLAEGDVVTGYLSDEGMKQMREFGLNNLMDDDKRSKIFNSLKSFDEELLGFKFPQELESESSENKSELWLKLFGTIKEFLTKFSKSYIYMEDPVLVRLEEIVIKACEREGFKHDEVFADKDKAKNFSEKEKQALETLVTLGDWKLTLHTHFEPVAIALNSLLEYVAKETDIHIKLVWAMTSQELDEFLANGKIPTADLESRSIGAAILPNKSGPLPTISTPEVYRKWKDILEPPFVGEIKGVVACRGKVKGKVTIHLGWTSTIEVPKGNVLVTGMTNPQMIPFIKDVAAIVTDEGGLTCHAAIISREMNIPCIVGAKVATRVLKDGDIVEVDAINGVVRLVK
jgi:phosphohistidine swiveling domain-containing protein